MPEMSAKAPATPRVEVNGRAYRLPAAPTVVVCVDGCEPDYLAQAVAAGSRPMSGDVWQLEDHGIATWVVGKMPSGCAEGEVTIRAKVAKDYLPKLSPARTARQYLVVE